MRVPLRARLVHRCAAEVSPLLATRYPDFAASKIVRPVFLIGCGRSGTTLLNNLLRLHVDIACWSEANEILDPEWYPRQKHGKSDRYRAPLEYDPVAFTRDWWESAKVRQRHVRACFGAYQLLRRKRIFINKSPFNTFRIPHLLEMFPDARFVHIARDGRAVVYSYVRKFLDQNKLEEWPEPQRTLFTESFDDLAVWLSRLGLP